MGNREAFRRVLDRRANGDRPYGPPDVASFDRHDNASRRQRALARRRLPRRREGSR